MTEVDERQELSLREVMAFGCALYLTHHSES